MIHSRRRRRLNSKLFPLSLFVVVASMLHIFRYASKCTKFCHLKMMLDPCRMKTWEISISNAHNIISPSNDAITIIWRRTRRRISLRTEFLCVRRVNSRNSFSVLCIYFLINLWTSSSECRGSLWRSFQNKTLARLERSRPDKNIS